MDIVHYHGIRVIRLSSLVNIEGNIIFSINLHNNEYLDIEPLRNDYENWIPFEYFLYVGNEKYHLSEKMGATFSVFELKKLINYLDSVIVSKSNNVPIDMYNFSSSEGYFDLIIYDTFEEKEIYVDLWINIASLTNGEEHGFDKGFRFVVSLKNFKDFADHLKREMKEIIGI